MEMIVLLLSACIRSWFSRILSNWFTRRSRKLGVIYTLAVIHCRNHDNYNQARNHPNYQYVNKKAQYVPHRANAIIYKQNTLETSENDTKEHWTVCSEQKHVSIHCFFLFFNQKNRIFPCSGSDSTQKSTLKRIFNNDLYFQKKNKELKIMVSSLWMDNLTTCEPTQYAP